MVRCLFDVLARDLQRTPAALREDARRAWTSHTRYEQRGGRNQHVLRRHFRMTVVVLEGLAKTGLAEKAELNQVYDVLVLLRFVNIPGSLVNSETMVTPRLIKALYSILTRRLELRPDAVVEDILLVATECLHDLCKRHFDDEQAGYLRSTKWFSPEGWWIRMLYVS